MVNTNELNLRINNTNVKVSYGDIFNQKSYKVIAFNEYFDTTFDNNIISPNSLNGLYISNYVENIEVLNELIDDQINANKFMMEINKERENGKKTRCKLGSVINYKDFLLLAFSRFDEKNQAFLTKHDYYMCMGYFWEEIDRLYSGYQVSIPLLGTGITRTEFSKQELLAALIDTFRNSSLKLTGEGLNIVLHDKVRAEINLSLF